METGKNALETMVSVIQKLDEEGYNTQFMATKEGLKSLKTNRIYKSEEIKVENYYRFEGESNPDDNSIVYAINAGNNEKGILTDSYGSYSDEWAGEFMKQVESINKTSA